MYALCGIDGDPLELSLKCNRDEAEALRQLYPAVKPIYRLNKRHWNTVTLEDLWAMSWCSSGLTSPISGWWQV